jgi:hypothetical protein
MQFDAAHNGILLPMIVSTLSCARCELAKFERYKQNSLRRTGSDPCQQQRFISVNSSSPHRLLGHEIEPAALRSDVPPRLSAPGLPELNHSQAAAVRAVLQSPLSLIQGGPLRAHPESQRLRCTPVCNPVCS